MRKEVEQDFEWLDSMPDVVEEKEAREYYPEKEIEFKDLCGWIQDNLFCYDKDNTLNSGCILMLRQLYRDVNKINSYHYPYRFIQNLFEQHYYCFIKPIKKAIQNGEGLGSKEIRMDFYVSKLLRHCKQCLFTDDIDYSIKTDTIRYTPDRACLKQTNLWCTPDDVEIFKEIVRESPYDFLGVYLTEIIKYTNKYKRLPDLKLLFDKDLKSIDEPDRVDVADDSVDKCKKVLLDEYKNNRFLFGTNNGVDFWLAGMKEK